MDPIFSHDETFFCDCGVVEEKTANLNPNYDHVILPQDFKGGEKKLHVLK